jgi:hypothetical protein
VNGKLGNSRKSFFLLLIPLPTALYTLFKTHTLRMWNENKRQIYKRGEEFTWDCCNLEGDAVNLQVFYEYQTQSYDLNANYIKIPSINNFSIKSINESSLNIPNLSEAPNTDRKLTLVVVDACALVDSKNSREE